jgi:hypothetical protein
MCVGVYRRDGIVDGTGYHGSTARLERAEYNVNVRQISIVMHCYRITRQENWT